MDRASAPRLSKSIVGAPEARPVSNSRPSPGTKTPEGNRNSSSRTPGVDHLYTDAMKTSGRNPKPTRQKRNTLN